MTCLITAQITGSVIELQCHCNIFSVICFYDFRAHHLRGSGFIRPTPPNFTLQLTLKNTSQIL